MFALDLTPSVEGDVQLDRTIESTMSKPGNIRVYRFSNNLFNTSCLRSKVLFGIVGVEINRYFAARAAPSGTSVVFAH